MTAEIKYHYFAMGVGAWLSWGRGESLVEAAAICLRELSQPFNQKSLKKLSIWKFPEDYELEFDLGYVRFKQGESKEPVDMKLVTQIKM